MSGWLIQFTYLIPLLHIYFELKYPDMRQMFTYVYTMYFFYFLQYISELYT